MLARRFCPSFRIDLPTKALRRGPPHVPSFGTADCHPRETHPAYGGGKWGHKPVQTSVKPKGAERDNCDARAVSGAKGLTKYEQTSTSALPRCSTRRRPWTCCRSLHGSNFLPQPVLEILHIRSHFALIPVPALQLVNSLVPEEANLGKLKLTGFTPPLARVWQELCPPRG